MVCSAVVQETFIIIIISFWRKALSKFESLDTFVNQMAADVCKNDFIFVHCSCDTWDTLCISLAQWKNCFCKRKALSKFDFLDSFLV